MYLPTIRHDKTILSQYLLLKLVQYVHDVHVLPDSLDLRLLRVHSCVPNIGKAKWEKYGRQYFARQRLYFAYPQLEASHASSCPSITMPSISSSCYIPQSSRFSEAARRVESRPQNVPFVIPFVSFLHISTSHVISKPEIELLLVLTNFLCNVKQDCSQQLVESWHV